MAGVVLKDLHVSISFRSTFASRHSRRLPEDPTGGTTETRLAHTACANASQAEPSAGDSPSLPQQGPTRGVGAPIDTNLCPTNPNTTSSRFWEYYGLACRYALERPLRVATSSLAASEGLGCPSLADQARTTPGLCVEGAPGTREPVDIFRLPIRTLPALLRRNRVARCLVDRSTECCLRATSWSPARWRQRCVWPKESHVQLEADDRRRTFGAASWITIRPEPT